ncbi:hypothetical protein ACWCYZ_32950 [Streptomyces virginiae]
MPEQQVDESFRAAEGRVVVGGRDDHAVGVGQVLDVVEGPVRLMK